MLQAAVATRVVLMYLTHLRRQQVAVVSGTQHGTTQAESEQVTPAAQRRQIETLQCLLVGVVLSSEHDAKASPLYAF